MEMSNKDLQQTNEKLQEIITAFNGSEFVETSNLDKMLSPDVLNDVKAALVFKVAEMMSTKYETSVKNQQQINVLNSNMNCMSPSCYKKFIILSILLLLLIHYGRQLIIALNIKREHQAITMTVLMDSFAKYM